MRVEEKGLVPILEVPPSERLVVSYGGPYSKQLLLNAWVVDRFLNIASLDGGKARVLINESYLQRGRSILDGVNPDGSIAGRRGLTWEEKREVEDKKVNPYFQVESDPAGWTISLNGRLIQEDLIERGLPMREAARPFTSRFNALLREGLQKALLKDKCTFQGDPFVIYRIIGTAIILRGYYFTVTSPEFVNYLWIGINLLALGYSNFYGRKNCNDVFEKSRKNHHFPTFDLESQGQQIYHRRSINSIFEGLSIPFEIDRLARGLGYLQYQKVKGNPLAKLAD